MLLIGRPSKYISPFVGVSKPEQTASQRMGSPLLDVTLVAAARGGRSEVLAIFSWIWAADMGPGGKKMAGRFTEVNFQVWVTILECFWMSLADLGPDALSENPTLGRWES